MAKGKIAYLEARLERLYEELAKEQASLEKFGEDDDYPELTVLIWNQKFSPRGVAYTFAALKVAGNWYTTSQFNTRRDWDELVSAHLSKAVDGSVYYATAWEQV